MTPSPEARTGEPLIGVEDIPPPQWALDRAPAQARGRRSLKPFVSAIVIVARLAWAASPVLVTTAFGLQALSGVVTAFGLLATADVFTSLLEQGPTPQRVIDSLPAIALFALALAVRSVLDTATAVAEAALGPRVSRAADDEVTAAVIGVDLLAFEDADFRELARQGGQNGVRSIGVAVREITGLTAALISMLSALLTVGILSPWLVPVLLLAAIADGVASAWVARLRYAHFLGAVTREIRRSVIAEAATDREFALERHALTLQEPLLAEYRRVSVQLMREEIRLEHRAARVLFVGRAVAGTGTAVAYVLLGALIYLGAMELALAGTAVLAMRTSSGALATTMRGVNAVYENSFYIGLYKRLLTDAVLLTSVPAPDDTAGPPQEIRLDGVCFTYPEGERASLSDVTMTVRRGQTIALVGQNGSGKSTLGKLLVGLYPPTLGTVSWDGRDLADLDSRSVHEQIAVVAQSPAAWPMSARHNVQVGRLDRHDPGDEGWASALDRSGARQVIASLRHGASTMLSKQFAQGQDLSLGQWQRLAIARALYRQAPVLLMDEPTSALDPHAETRVFEELRRAESRTGRISVVVTHRLANARFADEIYVLDQGRIVQRGSHDELVAQEGLYRSMYETQSAAFLPITT